MATNGMESAPKRGPKVRTARTRRSLRSEALVATGVVVLMIGLLAGGILGHMETPATASTTSGIDHLYLTVAFNPYTGLDEYFPANFSVPAGALVVVTITNYDNGTNVVAPAYAQVRGTVGNTETVSGTAVSSVPATDIAHTFTIDTAPYNINVPIPAAKGNTPTVVTFSLTFSGPGVYTWHCMAPCDPSAMTTPGFMMGTITVANN